MLRKLKLQLEVGAIAKDQKPSVKTVRQELI